MVFSIRISRRRQELILEFRNVFEINSEWIRSSLKCNNRYNLYALARPLLIVYCAMKKFHSFGKGPVCLENGLIPLKLSNVCKSQTAVHVSVEGGRLFCIKMRNESCKIFNKMVRGMESYSWAIEYQVILLFYHLWATARTAVQNFPLTVDFDKRFLFHWIDSIWYSASKNFWLVLPINGYSNLQTEHNESDFQPDSRCCFWNCSVWCCLCWAWAL